MKANLLQILPRAPGTFDGVGEYARILACGLRDRHGINSVFAARDTGSRPEVDAFRIFPLQRLAEARRCAGSCKAVILHYVNYGFENRGVPIALLSALKSLRRECGGALLVVFHELFASGPPWRSEFWLRPVQKKIARQIALLADARLVSCESMRAQLERLTRNGSAIVQPVTSSWGEPRRDESQLRERDPHCWIISGGTALLERSLKSFLKIVSRIPSEVAPRKLFVVGGANNPHVRALLNAPASFTAEYFPAIEPEAAAPMFSAAAFGWMDYFSSRGVPADVLLKSSTFLGLCAHGVTTVLPQVSGAISIENDPLPVPFALNEIPERAARADAAIATYQWYQRRASAARLSSAVAQQLQLV
jgi:hypothetical protein